jgi:hypothetical protein
MKGDFSRLTFDPRKHYGGVLLQQGRVQTDADWNEQEAIERYRAQALARELIGPCGGPRDAAGFAIGLSAGQLLIGAGRYWVDAILVENEAEVAYEAQPDLPDPPAWRTAAPGTNGGPVLVYLDVWERHITAIEDPSLRDPALGGPNTSTRIKTVWQVRFLRLSGGVKWSNASEWSDLLADRGARLVARIGSGGYQGLENQLYRVEVHRGGKAGPGNATFKWSRDNGSVVAAVRAVEGRDIVLGDALAREPVPFRVGHWAELSDDRSELNGESGQLAQVEQVNEVAGRVTLATRPTALTRTGGELDPRLHPKIRGWDQVEGANADGVATADAWLPVEAGIEIRFAGGTYQLGDYWLIPARTVHRSIEWPAGPSGEPEPQPPRGIVHRYCPLALLERASARAPWSVSRDLRRLFAPLAGTAG